MSIATSSDHNDVGGHALAYSWSKTVNATEGANVSPHARHTSHAPPALNGNIKNG